MRAPLDEDEHRGKTVFTCQTAALVPAARFLRPGFATLASLPRSKGGGAPRVVRVLARHPLGLHVTRQARRLTRRLASHTGDARLPALHRGDFGLRSRASLTGSSPKLALRRAPDRSQRAPRVRVVVPGGRGPVPPGAAVANRCRRTPRLAPSSRIVS